MKDTVSFIRIDAKLPKIKRLSTLVGSLLTRDCNDDCLLEASILRAKGIPVAVDFTPQWTRSRSGHAWCSFRDNTGRFFTFTPFAYSVTMQVFEVMAKAYRNTFSINPELKELNESGEDVPELFKNLCISDVTDEYQTTSDIIVDVGKQANRYAYLCIFDDRTWWSPVAFGKIRGRNASFRKMARNILYIAAVATENGIEPTSEPFVIEANGNIRKIACTTSNTTHLKLYRKHPPSWILDIFIGEKIVGSRFEASNRADFADADTIGVITTFGTEAGSFQVDRNKKYRYWRFVSGDDREGNLSEVYYIVDGQNIAKRGKIIGARGNTPKQMPENLYDNDPLTPYENPTDRRGWSGIDFGAPVSIDRILYVPRSDGNCVTFGDIYELKYWADGRWISLGKKTATDIFVEFDNCPADALFLLHDCTRGVEDRVFTCENGEVKWW